MVLQAVLDVLKALILFVIGLFPKLPDVSFIRSYVSSFVELARSVNMVLDLKVVGSCFTLILLVYNARAVWSVIIWAVRKIPGVS